MKYEIDIANPKSEAEDIGQLVFRHNRVVQGYFPNDPEGIKALLCKTGKNNFTLSSRLRRDHEKIAIAINKEAQLIK